MITAEKSTIHMQVYKRRGFDSVFLKAFSCQVRCRNTICYNEDQYDRWHDSLLHKIAITLIFNRLPYKYI